MSPMWRIATLLCALGITAYGEVSISLSDDGRSFVARGASATDEFVVRVVGSSDLPAMAGEVTEVVGGLQFTPQFPLTP